MKAIAIFSFLIICVWHTYGQADSTVYVPWQQEKPVVTLADLYPNSDGAEPRLAGSLDSLPTDSRIFSQKWMVAPVSAAEKKQCLGWNIRLQNPYPYEISLIIRLPNAWESRLYYSVLPAATADTVNNTKLQISKAGKGLPFYDQTFLHYLNVHRVNLPPGSLLNAFAVIQPGYSLYTTTPLAVQVQSLENFQEKDNKRHLWQGLFLGIILVMAFYNSFLWVAVRDVSYLHYVLSILGVGLYFAFYYGFGIEYLWPQAPRWDTWCYTIIVPFTSLARLWFTRTYLNTPATLPRLNQLMNVVNWLMTGVLLTGLITYITNTDWLAPLITAIGFFNTLILVIMLVAGILAYREKYAPARYFIIANAPLVAGAILFILREMGLLPDNAFTRYFVQVGVAVQVIMFALGLASRLNQTRSELAAQRLEKERLALETERERKEMIEAQKQQLEQQVATQTLSLRQQNEKLSQLNAVKDKLFSVLTHDLRNPLATMQSFLKLLTEQYEKLSEEDKIKLFKEAQDSLDHLNRLLFHLLQWSKSQMNLLEYAPEALQLATVAERNRRIIHLQARLKDIQIKVEVPEELRVVADANMLDFILRNLLNNAIKFSNKGATVWLTARQEATQVCIQVRDEGIGMSAQMVTDINHKFVSDVRRGTQKEKGTGLGLLISRDFIEKNGGNLLIESAPYKGTTIQFWLPTAVY